MQERQTSQNETSRKAQSSSCGISTQNAQGVNEKAGPRCKRDRRTKTTLTERPDPTAATVEVRMKNVKVVVISIVVIVVVIIRSTVFGVVVVSIAVVGVVDVIGVVVVDVTTVIANMDAVKTTIATPPNYKLWPRKNYNSESPYIEGHNRARHRKLHNPKSPLKPPGTSARLPS